MKWKENMSFKVSRNTSLLILIWLGVFINIKSNLLDTPGFMTPQITIGFTWIMFGEGSMYPTSGFWRSFTQVYIVSIPIEQPKMFIDQVQALLVDRIMTVNQRFYRYTGNRFILTVVFQQPQEPIQGNVRILINNVTVLTLRILERPSRDVRHQCRITLQQNTLSIRGANFNFPPPHHPTPRSGFRIIKVSIQQQSQRYSHRASSSPPRTVPSTSFGEGEPMFSGPSLQFSGVRGTQGGTHHHGHHYGYRHFLSSQYHSHSGHSSPQSHSTTQPQRQPSPQLQSTPQQSPFGGPPFGEPQPIQVQGGYSQLFGSGIHLPPSNDQTRQQGTQPRGPFFGSDSGGNPSPEGSPITNQLFFARRFPRH